MCSYMVNIIYNLRNNNIVFVVVIILFRTRLICYFKTPSSGQTICGVFDFNALAFRQKRSVVNRIAILERRRKVRGTRQV